MMMPDPADPLAFERPTRGVTSACGKLAAAWGLLGVIALLAQAVWRLAPVAVEALTRYRLSALQWALAAAGVAFMGFFEGYRGFQQGFSPRVVARALALARRPRALQALLAPMYCMGLIHAGRRRMIVSWAILVMVTVLIVVMRRVPQPIRGIVDLGVVVGLCWGLVALVAFAGRDLLRRG